ncbi:MAG: TAT-variant-translocated molybdopterin oxidoreductase [Verrucomicrobia bacterium]|nr:TAT-variant-translocated molybdopterin oxidoreductase [Verrucomicrobiota bacterium]
MKTIPPPCPEPEVGPKYWRSLDQLADTPEFHAWLEREFPAGASEWTDAPSRRHFVKIMSASFLLGGIGLTGCRRPEENILPFSKMPENYIHGVPKYYATARPTRGTAVPLLVKSTDGRPTKVEANPEHPASAGTDHFTQASILDLYDPDRAMLPSPAAAVKIADQLGEVAKKFAANGGAGLALLVERSSSPSRERVLGLLKAKYPKARVFVHEPVDFAVNQQATTLAFGKSVTPVYNLEKAKRILSLDADVLGSEEDSYRSIRGFARGRKQKVAADELNRLYVIEAMMTVTGANADHRLRAAASQVLPLAAALASEVLRATGAGNLASACEKISDQTKLDDTAKKWVTECAKDLAEHKGASVVVAGIGQPLAVHLIAHALNSALGAVGNAVVLRPVPALTEEPLAKLVEALNANEVGTLVSLGGNPVYNAPTDLKFADAVKKAVTVIRFGYYDDESAVGANHFIPAAHYLESWGDARTADGTYSSVQPLIEPLFGGFSELEVLARLAGLDTVKPHDLVRATFGEIAKPANLEEAWKQFLHEGFVANSAPAAVGATLDAGAVTSELGKISDLPKAPSSIALEVVFHRSYSLDDGRYNNNGWLQELPDPMTKATWENVVMLSAKTARDLGLRCAQLRENKDKDLENQQFKSNDAGVPFEKYDVVEVELNGRKITGPAWIQPGMADNVLALELGYGRNKTGRVGTESGYNAYALRTSSAAYIGAGAKLTATGRYSRVASTQEHGAMDGRPIVREANVEQYRAHTKFAVNFDLESHASFIPDSAQKDVMGNTLKGQIYTHPYRANPETASTINQWGMVIDLSSCVGCNACVIACQSENNIPIVGRDQVDKGREMLWMRIDRYFTGAAENPQVANQPMLCQHCESAPCESVCPVNATVHDEEGLNIMAYNRCVGTRYCSNNCPYKVRRFNFFDYNKRPNEGAVVKPTGFWWVGPNRLYNGVLAQRDQLEYDLMKLAKNPDVTVRMRGVMEKCTFCVQRIEQTKIAKKNKAGASGDVQITDADGLQTACQQACPAEAIEFGNLLEEKSRVVAQKRNDRNYSVLGFLDTKPRLTYLARIRNPNKAMPDFAESPLSVTEYSDKYHADPFAEHHGAHGGTESHGEKHEAAAGEKKGAH